MAELDDVTVRKLVMMAIDGVIEEKHKREALDPNNLEGLTLAYYRNEILLTSINNVRQFFQCDLMSAKEAVQKMLPKHKDD